MTAEIGRLPREGRRSARDYEWDRASLEAAGYVIASSEFATDRVREERAETEEHIALMARAAAKKRVRE